MRRFGVVLMAIVVVACGGDGAPPNASVGPTASTRGGSDAVLLRNTTWHIASIDGQPATADPPTKVFFALADTFRSVQVSGLCEPLSGTYSVDEGALKAVLELGETTKCDAAAAAYRQSIVEALNGATAWSVAGDTLTLTGAKTIVLERG
jgi:heat shock protein HslJ